jgi:hypothetical protein
MRKAVASLIVAGMAVSGAGAAEPTLDEVLARAAAYVADYQKRLQGIVAEEVYRQNVVTNAGGLGGGRARVNREGRELKSDILLVKLNDDDWWLQFRDVFEVDRKPVRDRDQRLSRLFIEKSVDARAQAESIQNESSRYNVGPVTRTINIPIMALLFFERANQPRLTFKRGEAGNVKRFDDLAAPESIWMIEYRETQKGTMVKGANNRDMPSHGRVWLDSTTGRILRTELISEDTQLRALVDVTYRTEPGLAVLVPGEMREIYNVRRTEARIDGRATYSKFRQFTVKTEEKPKGR